MELCTGCGHPVKLLIGHKRGLGADPWQQEPILHSLVGAHCAREPRLATNVWQDCLLLLSALSICWRGWTARLLRYLL